jgi:peroxiredoxin
VAAAQIRGALTVPTVFYVSYAGLWILVAFQTLVLLGLTRALHAARAAPAAAREGLRGQPVPSFSATTISGDRVDRDDLAGAALLFVSPDCATCSVTLHEVEALQAKVGGRVIVVCRSSVDRCSQLAQTYELSLPVLADDDLALSRLFDVAAAPTAVLIDEDLRVQSYGQPMDPAEFEVLLHASGAHVAGTIS